MLMPPVITQPIGINGTTKPLILKTGKTKPGKNIPTSAINNQPVIVKTPLDNTFTESKQNKTQKNRVNSEQCYQDYFHMFNYNTSSRSREIRQRTRKPNKSCNLNETNFTCEIPTLFSLPDCVKLPDKSDAQNNSINLEKYLEFWEISNTYKPNCGYSTDIIISKPGSIQMFVLKYNELVQSLHDKVVNFLYNQRPNFKYASEPSRRDKINIILLKKILKFQKK